ncbi:MAG: LysR family glycine cleavage system transcriptional activator [Planctomycetota bacterium]|jgi:LysR family glycine cleavage system transcriptional activator
MSKHSLSKFKSRRLPPLNALRAFESAGRLESLTLAARELNVTPAAVGHQVKALEHYFDQPLFERRYRAIALTDRGRLLLAGLTDGFDRLSDTIESFNTVEEQRALMISCCTSFAARWLVPRLDDFRVLHPDIDVRLDASQRLVDFRREGFDLGIRFGPGNWEGLEADYLLDETFIPVASPALLARIPVTKPADLAQHTLLHRDDSPGPKPLDWAMWLQAADVDNVDADRGTRYSMESMAIQAALDGHGIALVSNVLVEDDIAAGRLVRLFDLGLAVGSDVAYYLVYRSERLRHPRVAAFRDWILREVSQLKRLS